MLTTQELCELCDLPVTTLSEWVAKGFVPPDEPGGRGRGNAHRFGLMRAVGVAVAARLHQSERGCAPAYVGRVVAVFGLRTEAELLRMFEQDGTYFVSAHGPPDGPILRPKQAEWVDVRSLYRAVKAKLREAERAEKGRKPNGDPVPAAS